MAMNLGKLGYVPRLMGTNTPMGYVPRFGQNDFMEQIGWEENQWMYIAGLGAAALILIALMAKKRKRKRRAASPPSPPERRSGSLSVQYQG